MILPNVLLPSVAELHFIHRFSQFVLRAVHRDLNIERFGVDSLLG